MEHCPDFKFCCKHLHWERIKFTFWFDAYLINDIKQELLLVSVLCFVFTWPWDCKAILDIKTCAALYFSLYITVTNKPA